MLDRMDDSLLFPIPDRKARGQLLVQVRPGWRESRTTIGSTVRSRPIAVSLILAIKVSTQYT